MRAQAAGARRCAFLPPASRRGGRGASREALWPAGGSRSGIHPHQAGAFGAGRGPAIGAGEARRGRQACAIGEIGLDYHYDFSPRDVQQEVFRAQVGLALELRLPVVIHTREATDDTFEILREAGRGQVRGVFHCFTGDEEMARAAFDLDFYLSFAGIVTFPKRRGVTRRRAGSRRRSAAGRDRRAVSGARAASRQAQRAGACGRAGPWRTGRGERPGGARSATSTLRFDEWRRRPLVKANLSQALRWRASCKYWLCSALTPRAQVQYCEGSLRH